MVAPAPFAPAAGRAWVILAQPAAGRRGAGPYGDCPNGAVGAAGGINGSTLTSPHGRAAGWGSTSASWRTTWDGRSGREDESGTMVGREAAGPPSMRTAGAGREAREVHTGAGIGRAITRSAVCRSPILRSTRATKRRVSG